MRRTMLPTDTSSQPEQYSRWNLSRLRESSVLPLRPGVLSEDARVWDRAPCSPEEKLRLKLVAKRTALDVGQVRETLHDGA